MSDETGYFPILFDVRGKKCVVIGGGRNALQKVVALVEYGADVLVISHNICNELNDMFRDGKIKTENRFYKKGDLLGSTLAFASADRHEINLIVAQDATDLGIPVNVDGSWSESDFIVPISRRKGRISLAVSTGGISLPLARKLGSTLESCIGNEYLELAEMLQDLHGRMKSMGIDPESEGTLLTMNLDRILDLLRKGDRVAAREILMEDLIRPSGL